jgi:hypothetical protein
MIEKKEEEMTSDRQASKTREMFEEKVSFSESA